MSSTRNGDGGHPFLAGQCGALIGGRDWSGTPLGPVETWSGSLKTALGLVLHSPVPMALLWGPDGIMLYNDGYARIAGTRHPALLGSRVREGWSEVAEFNDNVMRVVLGGGTLAYRDTEMTLHRGGRPEPAWLNLDYSPVIDETGRPAGVFAVVVETTETVLARRREAAEHERLKAMCEQAPGVIAMLEGPEHTFVLANSAYRMLVGREDILGRSVRAALPELEDQGFFDLLDRVYRTGEPFSGRAVPVRLARSPHEPPEERLVDFIYQPIRSPDGTVAGIFVEGFDVTEAQREARERARVETALKDARSELEMLADSLPVLVSYLDREVRYRFVNRIYEDWFPRRRDEIIGQRVRDVIGEAAYAQVERHVDAALAGERVAFEQFMPYKEGRHRHISVQYVPRIGPDGEVEGIFTLVQDVTEARRSEARLKELNETLERRVGEALAERKIFADIVDGTDLLVQVADADFRWLAINRAASVTFAAAFGVREPRAGDSMAETLAGRPGLWEALRAQWSRALGGEEFQTVAPLGEGPERRHYELRYRTLRDTSGETVGAYLVAQDVTARLEEQARLREAESALTQVQKMEAIGQLTGGIAHDFNNVLGAVVAGFELILRRADDAEKVRSFAIQGRAAAERGAKLTGQLLAFARAQRIEVRPVLVCELIGGMRDLLTRTLGPMIRLDIEIAHAPVAVLGDPVQIEMSVLNLAINARDAMPEGGVLSIRSERRTVGEDPELAPGEYVEIAVADTGTGMPKAVAERAFDPFFTTKGVGKGTGLGLSQVYGSARQAGGTARIESEADRGTIVRMLLPKSDVLPERDAPATEGLMRPAPARTILLIDDDDDLRRMLASALEATGYRVMSAASGPAGLVLLEREVPDLIVIDFAMPDLTGAEVASIIRRRHTTIPIIFASGYADTQAIDGIAGPATRLLRKPFRIEELEAAVAETLGT